MRAHYSYPAKVRAQFFLYEIFWGFFPNGGFCQLSFSSIPTFASLPEGEEAINKVLSEAKTTFIGNDCPLELIISAGAAAARVAPFSVSISLFVRDSISV